jgi:flagellar motility protein MotE (MotC chaperone)/flagellar biosynthesis chaperone FliJ
MKGFQFRLERLHRVRLSQERLERERWAQAEGQAQDAERRRHLATVALEQGFDQLRCAQGRGSLSPAEVLRSQDALRRLAALAAREQARALRFRAEEEAARAPWLKRRAEVEGLERWRERELSSHRRDAARAAAQEMDETAVLRPGRERSILGALPPNFRERPPMSKALVIAAYALGGTALFCGAFLSFAVFSGEPLQQVAGLGRIVPTQPELPRGQEAPDSGPRPAREELLQAHAGVLGVFQVPAPLSNARLRELSEELQTELRRVREVSAELRARAEALAEREAALGERQDQLARLRTQLDALELDLRLRQQETVRDERVQTERERASWRRVARSFEEGDAGDLAERLTSFAPGEAALVLRELSDERAAALLQALPQAVYRDFVDAFRRVTP